MLHQNDNHKTDNHNKSPVPTFNMSIIIIKNGLAELWQKLRECDNQTRTYEESYAKLIYVYPAYTIPFLRYYDV